MGGDGYIWFSTFVGENTIVKKYSLSTKSYNDVTEGWLLDLNKNADKMLVSRYSGHPPVEERLLLDSKGEVLANYGDPFGSSSNRYMPKYWDYKSDKLVVDLSSYSLEMFLVDADLTVKESYKLPKDYKVEECGYPGGTPGTKLLARLRS